MTRSYYFTSGQTGTGKTSFAIAVALKLKEGGNSVGYFKPISWQARGIESGGVHKDHDAEFFKELLDMKEDISVIQPVRTGLGFMEAVTNQRGDFQDQILSSFRELSKSYDYLLIESAQGACFLEFAKLSAPRLAILFSSDVIHVERADIAQAIDNTLRDVKFTRSLGAHVTGIIVNYVPPHALEIFRGRFQELLKAYSIHVWGIVPTQAASTLAPTAGEVAKWLSGEILVDKGLDRSVQNLAVGAMTPEQAFHHLRRMLGKAVITGGDRTDICLAALETDTACLILTGNIYPSVTLLSKAEEKGVPIILVPYDTLTTVKIYQKAEARETSHPRTLEQAKDLVKFLEKYIDFDEMLKTS